MQPLEIAENALMANLFAGTPYAHSVHGDLASLNSIGEGDLMNFYHQYYVDKNADLVIVGDISLAEAQAMASQFSKALPSGQKAAIPGLNSLFNPPISSNSAGFNNSNNSNNSEDDDAISDNEEEIRAALFENGPLSIAVDATDFQVYTKGIKTTCEYSGLNHGVLLVGYGIENGINYWIIKNSWGTSWGENGYIRLQRGLGLCGMNIMVSTSVLSVD